MLDEPLCAPCVYATYNTSALIVYIPPDGRTRALVNARGPVFVKMLQHTLNGEHPDFEPAGHFEINHEPTDFRAVTTVHGTAVCAGHIQATLERAQLPNGRHW